MVIGLTAGFAAVSFFSLIQFGFKNLYERLLSWPVWGLGAGSLLAIVLATRISAWLTLRWAPLAAGSGVSQIKLIYWRDHGHIPWKATAAKFIACSLGLAAGIGLGRRGPSVFICSGVASIVADLMKANSSDRRSACAAGAAAGLAASFNTPLAAVTFFLEEVLGDLNSRRLTIVLLASAMGVAVLHAFIGDEPIYPITRLATVPAGQFLPAIIVAVFSSFMGLAFMKFILTLRDHSSRWNNSPYWLYPVLGATLGWAVCFSLFCLLKIPGSLEQATPLSITSWREK
ncbi:MAG: chloride channel protein [Verrucomicrobia bacterium]|nr:chloride channel protein [Verrucomicrobiota bacterium]